MFAAQLYESIYLIIVTILAMIVTLQYLPYTNERLTEKYNQSPFPALIIAILFALFIGYRPQSGVFIDMMNYETHYNYYSYENFEFTLDTDNFIFDNFEKYIACNEYDLRILFVTMAFIYFLGMFIAFKKMFPKDILFTLIMYLGSFSTFSYGTNGIKAGAAASVFLIALAYRRQIILMALLCFISLGLHHSMILPIAGLGITLLYNKPKPYLLFWIICIGIAAMHITVFQEFFNSIADEQGQEYLSEVDGEFNHGFRPDFIFYSSFPIIAGGYAIFKLNYKSSFYFTLYNTYLIVNAIWLLCMYAEFPNRIAYLSWQISPIVMIYPYLDKPFCKDQYRKALMVFWINIVFTIAMDVIYYGIIK